MYKSLQSYFRSESECQARFARLYNVFNDPMSEVYLLFYQSVLPVFTRLNLLLQREYPTIFLVADEIRSFLKKLLSQFVKLWAIKDAEAITEVEFNCADIQLIDSDLTIGVVTKQKLSKLHDEGDITENDKKKFYKSVRAFYVDTTS